MNCLLCGAAVAGRQTFSELYFLRVREEVLCLSCQMSFETIPDQHCQRCYKGMTDEICEDCIKWEKQGKIIDHVSLYQYNEAMKSYFSRYKFEGDYLLRKIFSKKLQKVLKNYQDYTLVPIPVSQKREEERGFNQVKGLLDAARLPYQELLEKYETEKQSEKTRQERLKLEQPFYVVSYKQVPEKILLIDDIYTTGVTFERAKEAILKKGKKEIKTFSLAR
ncbi:competence protein ComFC [Streptococcus gallinaceus]|nr:competence protein ComFC [Streptococcus gallinaceus]MCP1771032.1 competence protein ComFC [Streptococcus gallinaceus]